MEVISGYEDKKTGDIFVTIGMADGYVKGKNGIGYTSELLEQWHNTGVWIGKMQNAHPSKNHPLVYEPKVDPKLGESAQLDYYVSKSNKWGFGTFVKTELKKLANGITRLFGTYRITEEGAKRAWREGKFPKFSSISTLMTQFDEQGFTTKAHPIASSSVEKPAMDIDVAKIHAECTGDEHTCGVTKVGESAEVNCSYCRHSVLTSFKDNFSSHSNPTIQESSMGNDNADASQSPAGEQNQNQELEGQAPKASEPTRIQGDEEKPETQEIDWKAKYEELERATKKEKKSFEEYKTDTTTKLDRLFKEKLESRIRNQLEKIPLFAFDNKEENRESEIKRFIKLYPRLTEDEIIENVESTYKLAPKMKAISEKAKVGESGITNDGKLMIGESSESKVVSGAGLDEVFG